MSKDQHRVNLNQLGEFMTSLGVDWTPRDLQSIVITPGKITVTRMRRDENDCTYVLPGCNEVATEVVTIAVVEK